MKTSEFKKRVIELGYFFEDMPWEIIVSYPHKGTYVNLSKGNNDIVLDTRDIELAKLCIEYAETPLSEREDEKKYIVILPDPKRIGKRVYALGKNLGEVIIRNTQREDFKDSNTFHLTEAEIKRNHEYLWQFAKEVRE